MAINIKELLVRTIVEKRSKNSTEVKARTSGAMANSDELVAKCVKEVLKQIQYLQER